MSSPSSTASCTAASASREPTLIDDTVIAQLDALRELAPLHNGPALAAIEQARLALPSVPHVAVFDTAFHATMPEDASDVRRTAALARGVGHSPLRLPRALGAVGGLARRGPAARRLPPRRRLLGHRRARRPLGRHDDGVQPARRRPDGDALRRDRRRDRAASPAYRAARDRGARARARARVRPARPFRDLRPGRGARGVALGRRPGSLSTSSPRRVAGAVAAMAASLGGLDALVFTARSRRELELGAGRGLRPAGRSSASSSTPPATRSARPDAAIAAAGSRCPGRGDRGQGRRRRRARSTSTPRLRPRRECAARALPLARGLRIDANHIVRFRRRP